MDERVEEVIEEEMNTRSLVYRVLISIALAMISFGQFNDTKELLTDLYERVTTNFTHTLEYQKLDELSIGRTLVFIEERFGPPEVIKESAYDTDLVYQYYNLDKAVVTILNRKGRVSGFVIVPTVEDFSPEMPYVDAVLGEQTFVQAISQEGEFYFDGNNLVYFAESQDLGKRFLFLQRIIGVVEYGRLAPYTTEVDHLAIRQTQFDQIRRLNELLLLEAEDGLVSGIERFRNTATPNFYAYTELDASLIAESLLTSIEFNTYFGDPNDQ